MNCNYTRMTEEWESLDDFQECPVCFEYMIEMPDEQKEKTEISTLLCNHSFHYVCITKWANLHARNPSCPLCRAPVGFKPRELDKYCVAILKTGKRKNQRCEFKYALNNNNCCRRHCKEYLKFVTRAKSRSNLSEISVAPAPTTAITEVAEVSRQPLRPKDSLFTKFVKNLKKCFG